MKGFENSNESVSLKATNSRTALTGMVKIFATSEFETLYGRFSSNPIAAETNQWQQGDKLQLYDSESCPSVVSKRGRFLYNVSFPVINLSALSSCVFP